MAEFKAQIEASAGLLKEAWTVMQAASGTRLPSRCYEHWTRKARLHQTLTATARLFPAREKAWEIVQAIASQVNDGDVSDNRVTCGTLKVDFSIARHLALTSYVTVTWSIYDRLANICGRLVAIAELSENPKQNPRLCEDFLGKKDTLSFGAHLHLQQAYSWPLKVAYKVRNWLVHEGYDEGDTPMFKGDRMADGFIMHDDAVSYLEQCCDYNEDNGKIKACCLSAPEECWSTRDILEILEKYHAEVDTMFLGLVKWSVGSFVEQIAAFSERDKATLASAAAGGTD